MTYKRILTTRGNLTNYLRYLSFLFFLFCYTTIVFGQEAYKPTISIKAYNEGQAYTCITTDSSGNVWAGTNKEGLFYLNQKKYALSFDKLNVVNDNFDLEKFSIQAIAADPEGDNLWVGHEGTGGLAAAQGGIERVNINYPTFESQHYGANADTKCTSFPNIDRDGLPTRNTTSITVDHFGTVWSAHEKHRTEKVFFPGGLAFKRKTATDFTPKGTWGNRESSPELPYPAYTCGLPSDVTKTPQSRNFTSVGVGDGEVWTSSFPYEDIYETNHPARILRYDLSGNYLGEVTLRDVGFPENSFGVFNGIYRSSECGAWVTLSGGKGFAVKNGDYWELFEASRLPDVLVDGIRFSNNAIWGNDYGEVFMGTNKGLIVFDGFGQIDDVNSYHLYTSQEDELISDKITGGYAQQDTIQWIATDNGIMRLKLGLSTDYITDTDEEEEGVYEDCIGETAIPEYYEDLSLIEEGWPLEKGNNSYHYYKIETELCREDGPNGENCNVNYIFDMIKANATLTAPAVEDFPLDNLTPPLLAYLSFNEGELDVLEQNVNYWEASPSFFNSSGRIQRISDVMPGWGKYSSRDDAIPFFFHLDLTSRFLYEDDLKELAIKSNPKEAISCQRYILPNNSNFVTRRAIFKVMFDILYCGDLLESPVYDPIVMVIDEDNKSFINYTLKGHQLYPGKVTRKLVADCGSVKMVSVGVGSQYCDAELIRMGVNIAEYDFKLFDIGKLVSIGNEVVGTILFKNIDLRLIKAFEEEEN